ncbi:hypothetical protein HYV10_00410 [Candidatus Dependentiae bacterium]|nr:hypothetical protein [Candidatus Dependentiae bacterium]
MKKITLISIFFLGSAIQVHSDVQIQKRIRETVQKHQIQAKIIKNKEELQKFLTTLKHDLDKILKDAPHTSQYKDMKKAVDHLNPKEIATNFDHFRTILKNVDKDIKEAILTFIPFQFKAFFLI